MRDDLTDAITYAIMAVAAHKKWIVFYATLVYGEYDKPPRDLPDGAYLLNSGKWYSSDLCPVLPVDVPKELRALCLLMGIPQ